MKYACVMCSEQCLSSMVTLIIHDRSDDLKYKFTWLSLLAVMLLYNGTVCSRMFI